MDTASCPRCRQAVDAQALNCPYCHMSLKAYGHPGMRIYYATGTEFLCQSCIYHADKTCTFPQYPHARECILYQNTQMEASQEQHLPGNFASLSNWLKRRQALLMLLGILGIAFLIASNRLHATDSRTPTPELRSDKTK